MAVPVARFQVKREKERELRRDLWEMRDAIDRYKDAADKGGMQLKADSMGYPPDLQTLVDGVDVQTKKVRFLRAIPIDPMTKSAEWGLRSNQDDADSDRGAGRTCLMCTARARARPSTVASTAHGRQFERFECSRFGTACVGEMRVLLMQDSSRRPRPIAKPIVSAAWRQALRCWN